MDDANSSTTKSGMAQEGYLLYTAEDSMSAHRTIIIYYHSPARWLEVLEAIQDDCMAHSRVREIWLENQHDWHDQVCLWKRS